MNADSNNTTFLSTSESVGEGHPGKFLPRHYLNNLNFEHFSLYGTEMLMVFRRGKCGTLNYIQYSSVRAFATALS